MFGLELLILAAALPSIPDGAKIRPAIQCFAIMRGDAKIGTTWQRIRDTTVDGEPAVDIVIHQRVDGAFDLRDHFILSRADLTPLAFDSRKSGKEHVRLVYSADRVTGVRSDKDKPVPIDVPLTGKTWEGNLWGVTFGALPLAEGATFTLPFYQYDLGVGAFTVTVTGSDQVVTPDGPVAVWTVDAGADPKRLTTYLIAKDGGAEIGTRSKGYSTRLDSGCPASE